MDATLVMIIIFAFFTVGEIVATKTHASIFLILPLIAFMAVGIVAGCLVAILVGNILGQSWQMSIRLAVTALFGFPAAYQISHEVANTTGDTPEEIAAIESIIAPKMILAGIVSGSIVSGLIASFMATWL